MEDSYRQAISPVRRPERSLLQSCKHSWALPALIPVRPFVVTPLLSGQRDRWIDSLVRLFSLLCGCRLAKVHANGEDLTDESKEGDQRVHRPDGCGAVGGTFFPLGVPSLESALKQPEGDEVLQTERAGRVEAVKQVPDLHSDWSW